jgi:hypothetical protein
MAFILLIAEVDIQKIFDKEIIENADKRGDLKADKLKKVDRECFNHLTTLGLR